MYIFKTHTHPYIQIVNIIFTYSRSHCRKCDGADGLFELSNFTDKVFQPPVESLQNMKFPKAEEVLLCVLLTYSERTGWNRKDTAAASSSVPNYNPTWCGGASPRGASSSILLSILLLCLVWKEKPGGERCCSGNWEALTEFNKGEGLNGRLSLSPSVVLRFLGGVRKDPEGPGGWW